MLVLQARYRGGDGAGTQLLLSVRWPINFRPNKPPTGLFLGLCHLRLEFWRQMKPWPVAASRGGKAPLCLFQSWDRISSARTFAPTRFR
jgi:hypothetical protein